MRVLIVSMLTAVMAMLTVGAAAQPTTGQSATTTLSYAGKTVLVTGSTDGLGRELARALATQGANVIVHGRNAVRGQALVDEIAKSGKGSATFIPADFSTMKAVRDFADLIAVRYPRLDLLVNNAGIAIADDQPRQVSPDGYEMQFAVNYLAGWILVNKLRPNLAAAAPSRILNISSGSAAPIDFDDVMLEKPGAHLRGYAQSKLAQVSMTVALAPSFAKDGITMIALHPATLMDTNMVRGLGTTPESTVADGRIHVMSLIVAPTLQPGAFYYEGQAMNLLPTSQPADPAARKRLVELSARLTGVVATK